MFRILATVPLVLLVAGQALAQETPVERATDAPSAPEVAAPTIPSLPSMTAPAATQIAPAQPPAIPPSQTTIQPLPPVRYYDGYERPRDAVHRVAALKAAQRRERIAARKAMGYSPLRPPTSQVPFMAGYSPYSIIRPPLHIPSIIVGRPRVTIAY